MKRVVTVDMPAVLAILSASPEGRKAIAESVAQICKEKHGVEVDPESIRFKFDEAGMVTGATVKVERPDGPPGV